MTAYLVDVHHLTHTCPADPDTEHRYDTRRTIVAVSPGGPCRRPVTVRSGDATAQIPCGRHVPRDQRCPACRTIVIEHQVTVTFMGHHGPQHPTDAREGTGAAA